MNEIEEVFNYISDLMNTDNKGDGDKVVVLFKTFLSVGGINHSSFYYGIMPRRSGIYLPFSYKGYSIELKYH